MHRLFWGLLFVLLDYSLEIGRVRLEILPDFVGYILLMRAMESLADRSIRFDRGRHLAFGLSILTGILFGADLLDPGSMTRVWLWGLELAGLAATLILMRSIRLGLGDLGGNTQNLKAMELILAVILPLSHLVTWVPVVGSICHGAEVMTAALYLAAFYPETKKSAG